MLPHSLSLLPACVVSSFLVLAVVSSSSSVLLLVIITIAVVVVVVVVGFCYNYGVFSVQTGVYHGLYLLLLLCFVEILLVLAVFVVPLTLLVRLDTNLVVPFILLDASPIFCVFHLLGELRCNHSPFSFLVQFKFEV